MSKKILSVLTVILLILTVMTASAKDINLTNLDGDNRISVLATISDINDTHITLEIYNAVGSKPNEKVAETIKLDKFRYTYCDDHARNYNVAKIGDNVFASLEKNNSEYKISTVAYKIDTVDIRTLNILTPVDMENKDCFTQLLATAYYIRSNGAQKVFNAKNDGELYVTKDGQEIKLYPSESKSQLPVKMINADGKTVSYEKSQDVLALNANDPFDLFRPIDKGIIFGRRVVALGIIFAGLILGMIIIYLFENKKRKL